MKGGGERVTALARRLTTNDGFDVRGEAVSIPVDTISHHIIEDGKVMRWSYDALMQRLEESKGTMSVASAPSGSGSINWFTYR